MMKKDLSLESKLAWRNVWKNKRRTVLTLLTIVVGCTMIVFMNAIATGGHDQMIEDAVEINTGHIQIHEKGFWDNRGIEYAFLSEDSQIEKIKKIKGVSSISKRIHAGGLLAFNDNTAGALVQAVDPETEKGVSSIYKKILPGGRYLEKGDLQNIIIGEVLAKNLKAGVGDTIAMISQGFDGSIAAENLTIVGLFNTGNPEYDQTLIIMPFAQAAETFTMMGYINSIVIRLEMSEYMDDVKESIIGIVDKEVVEVMGWDELMPELVQFIVMDDVGAYIFVFILFMIIAFGILNTIQMSVYERIREFGVMLAVGTRPEQVTAMILIESVYISIIGITLGLIAGSALSYYFVVNPMNFTEMTEEMKVWGVSTVVWPARITSLNIIVTSSLTFLLSFIFSIFPARRASKLKPIEAIKHL